jgi:hypothetical protein
MNTFAEILDQADSLSLDEKESLVEILQKRISEYRRSKIVNDIQSAQKEFEEGKCVRSTADDIIQEILL